MDAGYTIEEEYLNHSENPIGVLTYFERSGGKNHFEGKDLFGRSEVLARDYSSMFEDAELPESYNREFAPIADLIEGKNIQEVK